MKMLFTILVAALTAPCASYGASLGDWITGSTPDGQQLYAGSINESGGTLTKACRPATGVCYWYLITSTICDKGQTVPALFSTSKGAVPFQLSCETAVVQDGKTNYRSIILDPDKMDSILESTMPLGIAVALQDGRFAVYRFSMSGAKRAVSILMEGANKLGQPNSKGTRDTTL
ncbi:hypothetical protein AWB80_06727 [Caballeronia pedi]|uniref:Lipoprotein n=1 Tax=Caballeronia pedi TaxID=1777141 RepID=A0A158DE33_9BURK|nr:hypothetical protein [Caballeronia pedi]SAK92864.1 hypothetical protein AWB80_06727 [Caballeronia pedi]